MARGQIRHKEMAAKEEEPERGLSGQVQALGSSHLTGQDPEARVAIIYLQNPDLETRPRAWVLAPHPSVVPWRFCSK